MPAESSLAEWAERALAPLVAEVGVEPGVLVQFILSLETDEEVRGYCADFLGESAATADFAAEFCSLRAVLG